jgi:WD40 repeat protein
LQTLGEEHASNLLSAISILVDGGVAASADVGGCLVTWEAPPREAVRAVVQPEGDDRPASINRGVADLTGVTDGWVFRLQVAARIPTAHTAPIRAVALVRLPSGVVWVVSGSEDTTLSMWEALSGTRLRTLRGHSGPVTSVQLAANEHHHLVVSASEDGTARCWDLASGSLLSRISLDAVFGEAAAHVSESHLPPSLEESSSLGSILQRAALLRGVKLVTRGPRGGELAICWARGALLALSLGSRASSVVHSYRGHLL